MTKKKKHKRRVRAHSAKTGMKYSAALRQLDGQNGSSGGGGGGGNDDTVANCPQCGGPMKEQWRDTVMSELPDEVSEGQMADYMAAEFSGDFGEWGFTEVHYRCGNCSADLVVQLI